MSELKIYSVGQLVLILAHITCWSGYSLLYIKLAKLIYDI